MSKNGNHVNRKKNGVSAPELKDIRNGIKNGIGGAREGAGRHSKYSPAFLQEAEKLATIGVTQKDMAYYWNVHPDTVTNWKRDYPEFSDAINRGDAGKRISLLTAMFQNAVHKKNPAVQIFLAKNWLAMRDIVDLNPDSEFPMKVQIVPADKNGNADKK
jgi:hypothetical protein